MVKDTILVTGAALDAAKRERSRLRVALADVSARREKAGAPIEALRVAESAAGNVAHAAAAAKWLHCGCEGPRPAREDFTHSASTPEVLAARHAAANAVPALEKLNAEASNIQSQLAAANAAVVDAAAKQTAAHFAELSKRAEELRSELAEIEDELSTGYHHFVELSDHDYARTGSRNPALRAASDAALGGFDEETASIRDVPMVDTAMLAKHREEFARLQEG